MRQPKKSPLTVAYHWASVSLTISMEMVLPALGGMYLDNVCGTSPWLLLLGGLLGLIVSLIHLIQLSKPKSDSHGKIDPRTPP
jgi:F0F1-type ATP synthase assembly protein I